MVNLEIPTRLPLLHGTAPLPYVPYSLGSSYLPFGAAGRSRLHGERAKPHISPHLLPQLFRQLDLLDWTASPNSWMQAHVKEVSSNPEQRCFLHCFASYFVRRSAGQHFTRSHFLSKSRLPLSHLQMLTQTNEKVPAITPSAACRNAAKALRYIHFRLSQQPNMELSIVFRLNNVTSQSGRSLYVQTTYIQYNPSYPLNPSNHSPTPKRQCPPHDLSFLNRAYPRHTRCHDTIET